MKKEKKYISSTKSELMFVEQIKITPFLRLKRNFCKRDNRKLRKLSTYIISYITIINKNVVHYHIFSVNMEM